MDSTTTSLNILAPPAITHTLTTYTYECVVINSIPSDIPIANIPIDFVHRSGLNSWRFVIDILRRLPNVHSDAPIEILSTSGNIVNVSQEVRSGTYGIHQYGFDPTTSDPLPMSRPKERMRIKAVSEFPAGSWYEEVVENTADERFGDNMIIRDSACLLNLADIYDCTPTRIVPVDRPLADIYKLLLGISSQLPLYHVSSGLLLRRDLGIAFERYEWSLYHHENGIYYSHFFDVHHPLAPEFHGRAFPISRFRFSSPYLPLAADIPNDRLLAWHYQQGVQVFADVK